MDLVAALSASTSLDSLRVEFPRDVDEGLDLTTFVRLLKRQLDTFIKDELSFGVQAVDLFKMMDVRGDGEVSWRDFTDYVLQLDLLAEGGRGGDGSALAPQAAYQVVPPQGPHKREELECAQSAGGIRRLRYLPAPIGKVALLQAGADAVHLLQRPERPGDRPRAALSLRHLTAYKAHEVLACESLHGQDTVVCSSTTGPGGACYVTFWDLPTESERESGEQYLPVMAKRIETTLPLACLFVSPHLEMVLGGATGSGMLMGYDVTTYENKVKLRIHNAGITEIIEVDGASTKGNSFILTGSHDGNICVLTIKKRHNKETICIDGRDSVRWVGAHEHGVLHLAHAPQHGVVVSSGAMTHWSRTSPSAMVWRTDPARGLARNAARHIFEHKAQVCGIAVVAHQEHFLTGDVLGQLLVWDLNTFDLLQMLNQDNAPPAGLPDLATLCVLPRERRRPHPALLLTAGRRDLRIFQWETQKLVDPLVAVCYNSRFQAFVTASATRVTIWGAADGRPLRAHPAAEVCGGPGRDVAAVCLDNKGRKLVVGDDAGGVAVCDFTNGRRLKRLDPAGQMVTWLQYPAPDTDACVLAASMDGTLQVLDESDVQGYLPADRRAGRPRARSVRLKQIRYEHDSEGGQGAASGAAGAGKGGGGDGGGRQAAPARQGSRLSSRLSSGPLDSARWLGGGAEGAAARGGGGDGGGGGGGGLLPALAPTVVQEEGAAAGACASPGREGGGGRRGSARAARGGKRGRSDALRSASAQSPRNRGLTKMMLEQMGTTGDDLTLQNRMRRHSSMYSTMSAKLGVAAGKFGATYEVLTGAIDVSLNLLATAVQAGPTDQMIHLWDYELCSLRGACVAPPGGAGELLVAALEFLPPPHRLLAAATLAGEVLLWRVPSCECVGVLRPPAAALMPPGVGAAAAAPPLTALRFGPAPTAAAAADGDPGASPQPQQRPPSADGGGGGGRGEEGGGPAAAAAAAAAERPGSQGPESPAAAAAAEAANPAAVSGEGGGAAQAPPAFAEATGEEGWHCIFAANELGIVLVFRFRDKDIAGITENMGTKGTEDRDRIHNPYRVVNVRLGSKQMKSLSRTAAHHQARISVTFKEFNKFWRAHEEPISSMCYVRSCAVLATASSDSTVRLWQRDGTLVGKLDPNISIDKRKNTVWKMGELLEGAGEDAKLAANLRQALAAMGVEQPPPAAAAVGDAAATAAREGAAAAGLGTELDPRALSRKMKRGSRAFGKLDGSHTSAAGRESHASLPEALRTLGGGSTVDEGERRAKGRLEWGDMVSKLQIFENNMQEQRAGMATTDFAEMRDKEPSTTGIRWKQRKDTLDPTGGMHSTLYHTHRAALRAQMLSQASLSRRPPKARSVDFEPGLRRKYLAALGRVDEALFQTQVAQAAGRTESQYLGETNSLLVSGALRRRQKAKKVSAVAAAKYDLVRSAPELTPVNVAASGTRLKGRAQAAAAAAGAGASIAAAVAVEPSARAKPRRKCAQTSTINRLAHMGLL